ncbi:MAG: toll/interleukin-1 receptor domain-containing protein, partial [Phototrophicaceae bacterium]
MARIFISYAHDDKDFTDSFVSAVREFYRRQNVTVWYDEDLRGGDHWWREIMRQLFYTDIFIYLMSKKALNSAYCQAEFREAYRLHKQIITVRVDEEIQIEDPLLAAIQYVDLSRGIEDGRQSPKLFSALNEQLGRVPRVRLLPPRSWKRTPQPPDPDKSKNATVGNERVLRQPIDINTRLAYIQTITALVGILLAIVFGYIQIAPILEEWGIIQTPTPPTVVVVENTPTSEITPPAQEGVSTLSAVDATLTEIYRQFSFATETEQARLAPTQTAYATETLIAQATASQHALETAVEQAFRDATATQQAIEREVYDRLATQITHTPTATATLTSTPTATLTALEQAIERART